MTPSLRTAMLVTTFFTSSWVVAQQPPVTGLWQTIDDKTGNAASVVEIRLNDQGELEGRIQTLLRQQDQGKVCDVCPEPFKDQAIEGLTFMWGLQPTRSGNWQQGRILDPESGSIYRSQLTLSDDGQTITVRGYIGVSWLGRSQQWHRVADTAYEQANAD